MDEVRPTKEPLSLTHPNLAKEWDYDKNDTLKPEQISAGSNRKVWWICPNNHSYCAQPNSRKNGAGCPYCAGKRVLTGYNDLATTNPDLAKEWDYDKNAPLVPSDVSIGSNHKVWWKCDKNHSWEALINNRNKGSGCPYCCNTKVLEGFNDLATTNPDLAKEWNYKKNINRKDQRGRDISLPTLVTAKSSQKVWWKCDKGHEWEASVDVRTNGFGCPICSNKQVLRGYNDLATTNPDLAKEWDYKKNKGLTNKQGRDISTPDKVTYGAHQKVWWICPKGHEYSAVIEGRSRGGGCPYCSSNSRIVDPGFFQINDELLSEWDYDNNLEIDPLTLPKGFRKAVWWQCSLGHIYKATIPSRNRGKKCPYCMKDTKERDVKEVDLEAVSTDLFNEWDADKNVSLNPHKLKGISIIKAWWRCKYGHRWQALVSNRLRGTGCPYCKSSGSSMPEQGISYYLSYICRVEQRIRINKREIDIYLPDYKIGIEYDGLYFHSSEQKRKLDNNKDLVAIKSGLYLLRVKESDTNKMLGDDIIMFKADNMGLNYEWALKQLFKIISILTENNDFLEIDINVRRDRLKIRERLNLVIKENSLAFKYPETAKEWDYEKNGILKPEMFSYGAQDKVWWKCNQGHSYEATIGSRTNMKSGCPFCAGKALLPGFNDILTINPSLAEEWNYEKNKGLKNKNGDDISTPDKVTAWTKQKVWWKCENGHEWASEVSGRSRGNGCPICSHQVVIKGINDLATTNPRLAEEWNYEKNVELTPQDVTDMSGKRVWWKCSKGHEWQANINNRCRGNQCPVCTNTIVLKGYNDLKTINPTLASEWNYKRNKGLTDRRDRDISTPDKVTVNSSQKVWWVCKNGHEWQATVANRNGGSRCLLCLRMQKKKKVINIDTGEMYDSAKAASIESGAEATGICNCCNGKQKTAGGFHWKYAD